MLKRCSLSPSNNNSRIPETDPRDPETETGILAIEERVHRRHGTLETELQMVLRSLVAPTRGGRRILLYCGKEFGSVGNNFCINGSILLYHEEELVS